MADNRLSFEDFRLFLAAFEVRYDNSYYIWDRAGMVWTEVLSLIPELRPRQAEPNRTVFGLFDASGHELQLTLQNGNLAVAEVLPDRKLQRFSEVADLFSRIVAKHLEVTDYTRVGLRTVFIRDFGSSQEAAEAILSTGCLKVPGGAKFGVAGNTVGAHYLIRKEDGKNGFTIALKAEHVSVEFDPGFGFMPYVKSVHDVKYRATLEVDSFLMARVSRGQLIIGEWLSQTYHVINRDCARFLDEIME